MPIIDSSSNAKFDALIRINKAESLMSFIMATYNAKSNDNKKMEIANRLRSSYELFRENVKGTNSGAGSYGQGNRNVLDQFESHYTMGYEMGIWEDSDFSLTPLARDVAKYNVTVKEYIGRVFLNLFTYYNVNGEDKYHHFLYEVLNSAKSNGCLKNTIHKDIIVESLPVFDKRNEQANLLFNYLIATEFFDKIDKDNMCLSSKWKEKADILIDRCNLEFSMMTKEEAFDMARDKKSYARYITKEKTNEIHDCSDSDDYISLIEGAVNELYYGVPGAGKSWRIDQKIAGNKYERVVFHPDYTYTDFVGGIMPRLKKMDDGTEKLTYVFVPGPFTKAIKDAINNPSEMHYLVIEEVNRGNAPAIFGDIFQLLDRDDDGASKYHITNFDIATEVYGNGDELIKIPSNLSVLATMNTSDQNVFTLDTAFQRRWNMKYIENDVANAEHANLKLENSDVTWGAFASVVNECLLEYASEMGNSEDKQLGAYFVKARELTAELFPEKAIKYLWDDAFKMDHACIFDEYIKSIGDIVDAYKQPGDPLKRIMKKEVYEKMMDMSAESVADAIAEDETFSTVTAEENE